MNARAANELRLMRYLDGKLSRAETTELEAWLRSDADARELLRNISEQAVALGDLARERELREPAADKERIVSARFNRPSWLALAAVLTLAGFLAAVWRGGRGAEKRVVVEVEDVAGALSWNGAGGESRGGLTKGARLPEGEFMTEGEGATAQLRFADGTRLTLGGEARAVISERGQKRVDLKSGGLAADVRPQPPGRPLVVRTPTALLEVLGTTFSVTSETEQTALNVERGLVRFERLADGSAVEVAGQHAAVASLDTTAKLAATIFTLPSAAWRWTFDAPLPPRWKGDWQPADIGPARARAVPCVAGRRADGTMVIQHGITARGSVAPLATLTAESVFSIRYRTADPTPLRVMLGVQKPDGAFGGNFEKSIAPEAGTAGSDGWRTVTVPAAAFRPLIPKYPAPPEGGQVALIFVTTYEKTARLEITELAIAPLKP